MSAAGEGPGEGTGGVPDAPAGEGHTDTAGYAPHPFIGGRTAALRALAAWRMRWPGAPRVIVLTGSPGSGRSRLVTGFLMLCDPEYRKRLPLDDLDPATVPPDLPAPAVPSADGLTAAQLLWVLADHFELGARRTEDIFGELAALDEPVAVVVPDVDKAGPVRAAGEPARLVRDVLMPLAATETVHLLAEVPRELAVELAGSLPHGQAQIIDLDAPQWADPEGLVLHAETALDVASGMPQLAHLADPAALRALAEAMARRAGGSRLTVQLAVQSLLMQPEGFDPKDESQLPADVGEALDLHARRLGADPQTLRLLLAPLAFAEGRGLPVHLMSMLASAVAGRDMSQEFADGMLLVAPFIEPVEDADDADEGEDARQDAEAGVPEGEGGGARTLLRLVHHGIAAEIRAGLPDARAAQTEIAMSLLEAVPDQDWSRADPYIRDHLAAHTLDAGLLPRLMTDPGLFAHADPVSLRAAIEAVPLDQVGPPGRTYLRTAPLLTRSQASAVMRAALLETAFVEDGLTPYAEALHGLGLPLPWRTLWSVPVAGVQGVTVGSVPGADDASPAPAEGQDGDTAALPAARPVAAVLVPEGTPGARTVAPAEAADGTAAPDGGMAFLVHDLLRPGTLDADPAQVLRPSEAERAAAPYGLSRGADHLRVWARESQEVLAALVTDTPLTGADISPDGILVVADARGVTARQILVPVPAAVTPTVPAQVARTTDDDASTGLEGDHA
ncbi:ATP-binding protein [Streptomyces sp. NPDC091266]|uniref:ATP-binding protein n=1 Tax=Streptomyces sp. NPDC091266 TaxID=3365978 RepID=UPI0038109980